MNWNIIYEICLYFFIYGFLGWCVEVAFHAMKMGVFVNRGFLNGPICPIYGVGVCFVVSLLTPYKSNLILLYLTSTILVTVLEFITGWILEKVFHDKWWDYSEMPLNIHGYVCLIFSIAWGVGCVIIVDFVHPLFATIITHLPFVLGVVLIVICGIGMFADLYVTAASIFKMNKKLARMDEIAAQLHNISDEIGEGIYKEVIGAMELQEEATAKLNTAKAESAKKWDEAKGETIARLEAARDESTERLEAMKRAAIERAAAAKEETQSRIGDAMDLGAETVERLESLYKGYRENTDQSNIVQRRLLQAFPKMRSNISGESVEKMRNRFSVLKVRKKIWKKERKNKK